MLDHFPVSNEIRESLHRWLDTWNTPELATRARIEWSNRLTRSLGRCYPDRRLIRIASHIGEAGNGNGTANDDGLLQEVLCHELAHLAARELHGPRIRPHGAEWKALMRAAGYEPKVRLPAPPGTPRPRKRRPRKYLYLHRCPVCHAHRIARRLMRAWRCTTCVTLGLTGDVDVDVIRLPR